MEIFRASYQWANRPDDERFLSIQAMRDQCRAYADVARQATASWNALRVEAVGEDLRLIGKAGVPADVAHYAFGQLAQRAGAPPAYLRSLSTTLAAQNLNYGLSRRGGTDDAQLLFHDRNGAGLLLRAATGTGYERVWNWEVCDRLLDLQAQGWDAGGPDFSFEGLPHSADPDLYASDHDMFAFIRHPQRVIDDGTEHGLRRGLIVANSEVGDRSLSATYFLYRYQCGNHIIWGAQDVKEIRVAHRGTVRDRWAGYMATVSTYLDRSVSDEEATIVSAQQRLLGRTKEEVLDALFGKRQALNLSRTTLEAGYDAVVPDEDGDPGTVWGYVQGLTRHAQTIPYADQRTEVDRAAGRILQIAF